MKASATSCVALAWLTLGGAAVAVTLWDPVNISDHYFEAAEAWRAGADLYAMTGHGFLYLPQAAILALPFTELPAPLGHLVWRIVGLTAFAWGISRWSGFPETRSLGSYAALAAAAAVLCAYSLRIGQATLLMTGLALAGTSALGARRYVAASLWLTLALAVKPLAVVFALLAVGCERRIRLPMLAAAVALALAPFALQETAYVLAQYGDFGSNLRMVMELGNDNTWSQPFGMLGTMGVQTPASVETGLRVAAALGTLALAAVAWRGLERSAGVAWFYVLGATYLMLCNPRNEASTYCLLGPAIGFFFADEIFGRRRPLHAAGLGLAAILIAGDYEIGRHFVEPGTPVVWLAPLVTLGFTVYLGVRFRSEFARPTRTPAGPGSRT